MQQMQRQATCHLASTKAITKVSVQRRNLVCNSTAQPLQEQQPVGSLNTGRDLPNPLIGARGVVLQRITGTRQLVQEVVEGKARNLAALRPAIEAAGYKLVVVSIGYPQAGREFCEKLPFPPELLYLDPDRNLYRALHLKDGMWSFFSPAMADAWRSKDLEKFKTVMADWKLITPPSIESTTQQGGLYVFDGPKVQYAWQDPGIGAHAPNKDWLPLCCDVKSH